MFIFRPRRIEACLIALLGSCTSAEMRMAPNHHAAPVNQLSISGNACGPAALLASYRAGGDSWQAASASLPGTTDREQLRQWILRHGRRPSATLSGKARWNNGGINVEDLTAAANEQGRPLYLPSVDHDDLFSRRGESPSALLRRTHARLDRSLAKGIPPLLSLRRFVLRNGSWTPVHGHFVTVTGVPGRIGRDQTSFTIHYLDPLGGKACTGLIRLPERALLASGDHAVPCLEAVVPESRFGLKDVRRGEESAVVPAAVIGRW